VARAPNIAAAGVPVQGSLESIDQMSNVWMMFPFVLWTCSCGFPLVTGLSFRPQSFLIILATSTMKSVHRSRVIHCGRGCLVNQVVSQMSAASAAVLLEIHSISNQPVAGWIMVRHHSFRFFLPLRSTLQGPVRSTRSASHRLSSASFAGSSPHFWFVNFAF
jgi:hypothetical protein